MTSSRLRRFHLIAVCAVLGLVASACGLDDSAPGDSAIDDADDTADVDEFADDGIDCSGEALGNGDEFAFKTAHFVVDGELGDVCLGEADATLTKAWNDLAAIAPAGQLADLALFGGFIGDSDSDEITFAFVNAVDDEGSAFQMSVNLTSYAENADEGLLTMAHEFTHVFTAIESELDRTVFDADDCDTFYNGEGCYVDGSIMAEWIRLFWGNGLIEEIDPDAETSAAAGEERCATNPGFFGPYAASNPEEDFAETFSAYVYQLPADNPEQQAKLDWIEGQAGLAEFRDRAIAAGQGPIPNGFDFCGEG